MKILPYIIGLILLANVFACQRETTYPFAMKQAESLMNTRPDSALYLLQNMADSVSALPEEAQMYYHLLTIQAKDKQYITHTSDSLINNIVSFYENYDDKERLMLAYFYQGSTYRDMNDAPRALKAFHQTIDAGKVTENLTLLGQAYGQMGALLSKHKLYDEALEVHLKCLSLYRRMDENQRIPLVYRNIARMYNAKEKNDSAIYFYEKGYQIAKERNDERSLLNIVSELGCQYYREGYLKKAKYFLYPLIASLSPPNNTLLYMGLIYDAEDKKDSARYFLNQTLNYGNTHQQNTAHKCLAQIEEEEGNKTKAAFHQKQHQILQDSIESMVRTENLKEEHQTFNYERLKKDYATLQQESHNYRQHSMLIGILVIITTMVSFTFFYWKKKKGTLPSRNNTSSSALYSENIFHKFQKAGRDEATISDNDWIEFHKLMEKNMPDFTKELSRLTQEFKLSKQEQRICCLLKLGFINQEISYILRVTKSAISRSQSRLYGKLTKEKENASKMRLFIEDL